MKTSAGSLPAEKLKTGASFQGAFLIEARVMRDDPRTLKVKVHPRSSRPRVEPQPDGSYRVYVSSAPEKGKANSQALKALADHLGLKRSEIELIAGGTSRNKVFRVSPGE